MIMNDDLNRHVGKYYGKYSGEVTNNEDAHHMGCIMVKVPSIFGKEMEVKARPCLPYGHFFIPDKGTKVWIEFEGGNPDYPIWVGTWYAKDTAPEGGAVTPPETRVIHTPSGHTVEFKDTEGEEKIIIRHKLNSFISIDKDGNILLSNQEGSHLFLNAADGNATFMEQHGNLLTMNDKGVVIVNKDSTTIEMKGGKVKITAAEMVQVYAKDVLLNSSSVILGKDAMEPVVLGQTFSTMWNMFIAHTHATAMGLSGPPTPVVGPLMPGSGLSMNVKVK